MYTTWPSAGSPAFKGLESLVLRWHIPDSYNFVCGYNVPLEYLCLMDSENLKALYYDP